MAELKELSLEFLGRAETKNNFLFKQIKRSDKAYLYEVTSITGLIHFEIFERKEAHREAWNLHAVTYPHANSFGVWAWTTKDKDRAYEIFNELNSKVKEKA